MAETNIQETENATESHAEHFVKTATKGNRQKPPRPPKTPSDEALSDDELPLIERLHTYKPAEWERELILYGYRVEPITDRKLTGNKNYIRKWTVPIDIDDIKREFGSGVYKLQLNRRDETTGRHEVLGVQYVPILDMNAPPLIPLGEWVDDERNRDWWWAKPMLIAKQADAMRQANQGTEGAQIVSAVADAIKQLRPDSTSDEQNAILEHVLDTMRSQSDKMFTMLQQRGGASDLLPIVTAILDARKGDGGESPFMKFVMDRMASAEDRFNKLLEKLTDQPRRSLKDEISDALEIAQQLRGRGRSDNPAPQSEWVSIVRDIAPEVFGTLNNLFNFLTAKTAATTNSPQGAPNMPRPGLPPAPMTPQQQQQALMQLNAQYGPMFDRIVPTLVDYFKRGKTGLEFQDWFLQKFGDFIFDEVVKLTPDALVQLINVRRQVGPPAVQQQLAELQPPEKVLAFMTEFLSEPPIEDDETSPTPDEVANDPVQAGLEPNEKGF